MLARLILYIIISISFFNNGYTANRLQDFIPGHSLVISNESSFYPTRLDTLPEKNSNLIPTPQKAWLHGLPGFRKAGGEQVEILNLIEPKPGEHKLTADLIASNRIISKMRNLSGSKTKISEFSLVIRTDLKNENDDQYQLADVLIVSVKPSSGGQGSCTVIFDFASQFVRKGIRMQPGPPPNPPEVRKEGSNTGWIFGTTEDHKKGIPFAVNDFTEPHFNGQLVVYFENLSIQLNSLLESKASWPELILVLPDRSKQRYIEYKFWDVKFYKSKDEQHWVFESDIIECLTGNNP